MAQYLKYPVKTMSISQNYNGGYSHSAESTGSPKAYPIDECCGNGNRDYFYAPCDLVIKRIYGVGNKGTNTIWMQSQNKVKLANGTESIVTIRVTHPEDDDLKKYKVGQKFKQGAKMFREGKDGQATGNHFHIELNNCEFKKLSGGGWVKNNKGGWVTAPNSIKPEDGFYVDRSFTTIKNAAGLKFKNMPINPQPEPPKPTPTPTSHKFKKGDKVIINGNLYKNANAEKPSGKVKNKKTTITRYEEGTKHPYNTTGDLGWMDEEDIKLQPTKTYYPKCASKYTSFVDALKSIKVNSSFANRFKIASKNGIKIYVGTSSQNIKLLNLLKQGKLIKP